MTGEDPPGGRPNSGAGAKVLGGRTQEVVVGLCIISVSPLGRWKRKHYCYPQVFARRFSGSSLFRVGKFNRINEGLRDELPLCSLHLNEDF